MISQVVVAGTGTPLISTGNEYSRIDRIFVDERQLTVRPLHGKAHLMHALGPRLELDGYIPDLEISLGSLP